MNKSELVSKVAEDQKVSKTQATKFLDSFINTLKEAVQKEERVSLKEFGTFKVTLRKAREGRNPSNGKKIDIAEKKVATFKASKKFSI